MPRRSWLSIFISALLLLSAAMSYVFFIASEPDFSASSETLIEESMSGVCATRFDKTGQLHQTITMMKWEHIKGDTVTSMQAPSLTLYYPNGKICKISSDLGEGFHADLKDPLEKLHLIQNVIIEHTAQQPQAWWELKTASLVYFPSSQTAMTDDKVTVLSPSALLESQGMKVYLEQQRVEFIHQVTSQYAKST